MLPVHTIWIVTPSGYVHSQCFNEVALAIQAALAALGQSAPIVREPEACRGTTLVFGPHLLPRLPRQRIPDNLLLFNLEQVSSDSVWLTDGYRELLGHLPVLDYSRRNIAELSRLGLPEATLCEIGYRPELTRIPREPAELDVLFYGSLDPRRAQVLTELQQRGVRVRHLFGVYGEERDRYIARSRIVLSHHLYTAKVFEIVRVSYLLANRCPVVAEYGTDPELEAPFVSGVAFAEYDHLVARCLALLADDPGREALAERGFEAFRQRDQAALLEIALGRIDPAALARGNAWLATWRQRGMQAEQTASWGFSIRFN
jgi:hypothetical protein